MTKSRDMSGWHEDEAISTRGSGRRSLGRTLLLAAVAISGLSGCGIASPAETETETETETEPEERVGEIAEPLASYDCAMSQDTGYTSGNAFAITVVTVDGDPVEIGTANAFLTMAQAAENDGIQLRIASGFRTMAQQQYFYGCYINCNCNNCNLAAKPGYSNHQSGHALDLNTSAAGVLNWLNAHGATYGFSRTVPSEAWHWEWWGGGVTPGLYCSTTCDRSAGGFTFSCDGPNAGQTCVNVNEPGDPDSWGDNYFCGDADWGLKWSSAGPIAGMVCTNVAESAEPQAAAWSDNYICLPQQSAVRLQWNSAGAIAGMSCVHWNEPGDTGSWSDNHLCAASVSSFSNGGFTFSSAGPSAAQHCVLVDEPADPHTWNDNYFCSDEELGMQWSVAGPIAGMVCTNVAESADDHPVEWSDNYLCLPPDAPYTFTWSSAGPIEGKSCVRWYEGADLAGSWGDNWLCFEAKPADVPVTTAQGAGGSGVGGGSGGAVDSGGAVGSGGAGGESGSASGDASQAAGCSVSRDSEPASGWLAAALVALGVLRQTPSRARRRRAAR